ncbi:unnamed protein product [Triticum turgidum subsp. durum]|uniref:DUF4220 domain-containing protein n=1 Tax=Triticum turgidum subsp. durum TaxID=4567 RepID=A0A9R1BGS2_TRITD|nr:unnamed protein product [Triticum turgidum subsp. durum]
MRVLRDRQDYISAVQSYPPTDQPSLDWSSLGKLWDEWQIQCLMLVSFGLQVFLFFTAGMRRRSESRILRLLLWLAYLSADFVAIFALGHLALHANGPQHQLLFFWAPFVLLHLGGQDTMTAFSMQDNELWMRHLLGLVTQVTAAGYVISRTSWPDRRLLAAMVLMFLSGCFKYAERTLCLYKASPTSIRESSFASLNECAHSIAVGRDQWAYFWPHRLQEMLNADGRRPSSQMFDVDSSTAISLVSDTPVNDGSTMQAEHQDIQSLNKELKSSKDRCRVYDYVSPRLALIYERLYTKALLRYSIVHGVRRTRYDGDILLGVCFCCFVLCIPCYMPLLVYGLLLLFPLLSTMTALMLFKYVEKSQLYSRADVTVSYVLLIGAMILEAASLFICILSYSPYRDILYQSARKQWSEMLGQYNMTKSLTRQSILSFVPQRAAKHLDDNTSSITISEDLKKFVLDKLLDFGTRKEDWNFANFHGKLALGKWMDRHKHLVCGRLNSSINDLDLPTSVLIMHIATEILYFQDSESINSHKQTVKKMSRELSNYIMYLVFKCGVMLTARTEILHDKAQREMKRDLKGDNNICEKEAIMEVFESHHTNYYLRTPREQAADIQLLMDTWTSLHSPILPRACDVAQELIDIHREVDCWDLVSAVWVEMLYYIAPRCGGTFHSQHLSTGGEFITHVLHLMQLLGPFIPPPSA